MIQKQNLFLKLLLIICIYTYEFSSITFSNIISDEKIIQHELKHIQQLNHINSNQQSIIDELQSALHFIDEQKISQSKIKKYQEIIDNFPHKLLQLRNHCNNITDSSINIYNNLTIHTLKEKLLQIDHQLMNLSEQLTQAQDEAYSIHESLKLLPKQYITTKNILNNLEQQQNFFKHITTPIKYAKFTAFQAKRIATQLKITELEFAQLSSSNRQELSKLQITLLTKKYINTYKQLQTLRNQLNYLHYKQAKQTIIYAEKILSKQNHILSKSIRNQLKNNQELLSVLNQQIHYMNEIAAKKQEIQIYILQTHQTFSDLIEQSQWINKSSTLGETLHSKISKLPKIPKFQYLDHEIAQLRAKRLQYENIINNSYTLSKYHKKNNNIILTALQKKILDEQLKIQTNLITLLINNYDTQILELSKLKISYGQLQHSLQEIQQATHRYLFWVADIHPITKSYLSTVYQDLMKLIKKNAFHYQFTSILNLIYTHFKKIMLIACYAITLFFLHFYMKYHYYNFLQKSSKYIGKVNQDTFLITIYNIWYSIFVSLPIPILWIIIGYNLSHYYTHPIIASIGNGMYITTFMLWAFILNSYFASSKGLFIIHFGWSKTSIQKIFDKYYFSSVTIIIFLIIALTIFNNYNNREFSDTLGRLCFILLCIYLTFITHNLKYAGLPLYLNKHDSSNNMINCIFWNIMICVPIIAAISCAFGYLFTAQTLLIRVETSLFIWIILLIIYHIIRRWMFIQRRRIAFERAKQKRATQLKLRADHKLNSPIISSQNNKKFILNENNKKCLDLDTISTQSLQLIRSIITLIALLIMTLLWSELRSAFSFLENITLWDVTSTIKGVENIQPITLNTLLIIVLVIIITTKTVRNLPALLELTLLQHLNLAPGTGYAITTLTKYILMMLGSLIGFSLIGIEWVKIQWLIAALGVGLGFGLQEIFANFISGLMILFEKPIRIGDTITIQDVTGHVTHINTRATIITDWNHKEIIIPNKEFITKQFINWSLSNTTTRIILKIPALLQIDSKYMTKILLQIVKSCSLALNTPAPEVYLIDLQQGLPIFEIRAYTEHVSSRIPLRHQIHTKIIEYYKKNGIELPHLYLSLHKELINHYQQSCNLHINKPIL